ncbi:MAG: hypothetical protein J6K89_03890 [Oscillospiraceae bacterium]|nr:hypothetical protein [Oscillospiraceae bacterium]
MKETYVKPTIFIERFSLTQNIASGCAGYENGTHGTPINNTEASTCVWDMQGVMLFTSNACAAVEGGIQLGPNDSFDGVCYNGPTSSLAPFGA